MRSARSSFGMGLALKTLDGIWCRPAETANLSGQYERIRITDLIASPDIIHPSWYLAKEYL